MYYKCHSTLLFSKSKSFGLVNIEASAFGLYTITHDIGGISGCTFNNLNGFRFKLTDNIDYVANYEIKFFKINNYFQKNLTILQIVMIKLLNHDSKRKKISKIIN